MFGPMIDAKYLFLIRFVAALVFAAVTFMSFPESAAAKEPAVTGVRLGINDNKTRVVLDITKPVPYSAFLLENPYRLVIDLPELEWSVTGDTGSAKRGIVEGLRYGLFRPGNSRIVVDLKGPSRIVTHGALAKPDRLMFDLQSVPRSKYQARQTVALSNWKPPTAAAIPMPKPRPQDAKKRLVIIDAGHGGVDPGAVRGRIHEKSITLAVAEEVRRQLEKSQRYRVVMTRNRDIFIELRDRVKIAQENEGDIFISLHADTHPKHDTRGASIYTLSERASDKEAERLAKKENMVDLVGGVDLTPYSPEVGGFLLDLTRRRTMEESSVFASYLIAQFRKKKIRMQPIKTHRFAGFAVLKAPDVPSVLVELGYLSNTKDRKILRSDGFRKTVGQAVLASLDDYFKYVEDLAQR
jgi:N-acetylmuramoyl-L-alanine amidase